MCRVFRWVVVVYSIGSVGYYNVRHVSRLFICVVSVWCSPSSIVREHSLSSIRSPFSGLTLFSSPALNYCTISTKGSVTRNTHFFLSPDLILFRFMAILGDCRQNKKVTCVNLWSKQYSTLIHHHCEHGFLFFQPFLHTRPQPSNCQSTTCSN